MTWAKFVTIFCSIWLFSYTSYREWHSIIFSEIKTMIEMHSINLKMISKQIFCLANIIFITKFVISIQKQGKQFSLALFESTMVPTLIFSQLNWNQLRFLIRFKFVPKGSVIRSLWDHHHWITFFPLYNIWMTALARSSLSNPNFKVEREFLYAFWIVSFKPRFLCQNDWNSDIFIAGHNEMIKFSYHKYKKSSNTTSNRKNGAI